MNTLQQATTKPTSVMEQVSVYKVYQDSWNCWSGLMLGSVVFTPNFWKACYWA